MIKKDDHVGMKLIALDVDAPCSPCIEAIADPSCDENELVRRINDGIERVFKEVLGEELHWTLRPLIARVNPRTKIIKTKEERDAEWEKNRQELASMFKEADLNRVEQLKADPNNGKMGYWRIEGIRHSAIVKSDNALDAINKAKNVGDWESPSAYWLGEEIPDVLEC